MYGQVKTRQYSKHHTIAPIFCTMGYILLIDIFIVSGTLTGGGGGFVHRMHYLKLEISKFSEDTFWKMTPDASRELMGKISSRKICNHPPSSPIIKILDLPLL